LALRERLALPVRLAPEKGFIDHLNWHRIDGRWLITSKGFHVAPDHGH
jgi:hypothetical protein